MRLFVKGPTSMMQPRCQGCGQALTSAYITALGVAWHPEHFVCAGCGRSIHHERFVVHEGQPYHAECHTNLILPRCAYCGKPLIGRYIKDQWGTSFCAEHEQQYRQCRF